MRAVVIREPGEPDVLELRDVPEPVPGPGEVLVDVAATALNRADLLQRRGLYPAPPGAPADIPGLEFSGVVAKLGPGATRLTVGDRVMGIVAGGGYAEKLVVHERVAVPVPKQMDLATAAAIPEVFFTAYDALLQGRLAQGETLLISAVSSGVGTAAVQLAKLFQAKTVGLARSEEKLLRARKLGLEVALAVREPPFAGRVLAETSGRGADVAVDLVGGDWLEETLLAMAPRGRLVLVGLLGGFRTEVPLNRLISHRLTIIGTALRTRSQDEKIAVAEAFTRDVLPHFESGALVPVIDGIRPIEEVQDAHRRMESNANFGKLVLTWGRAS